MMEQTVTRPAADSAWLFLSPCASSISRVNRAEDRVRYRNGLRDAHAWVVYQMLRAQHQTTTVSLDAGDSMLAAALDVVGGGAQISTYSVNGPIQT